MFSLKHWFFNIIPGVSPWSRRASILGIVTLTLGVAGCTESGGQTAVNNVAGYACASGAIERFDQLQFDATGRVLCRGEKCREFPDPARLIDGKGRTLWPGLIDAHAHLLLLGQSRQQLQLTGLTSLEAVQDKLRVWAKSHPGDAWIVGRGWNQMLWPVKEFPQAADLDVIVKDRPVVLERVDGHALWVNSTALERAGIDAASVAPPGGEIVVDASGTPTGILVDNAEALVTHLIPSPSRNEIVEAYRIAIREANSKGLTGVHEAGMDFEELQALRELGQQGGLSLRIAAMLSDVDANLASQKMPEHGLYEDRLSIDAVKIYADGALGSRGAALLEPYEDRPETSGLLFLSESQLAARIQKANERGFQAAIHAIGDRANRVALDALAEAQGGEPSPLRNRIEHAQVLAPDDIGRFAQLGVIASMQPVHATSDMWMAEERLDPRRLEGAYAWQSLQNSGARLAFGSDFPVEPVNPFFGLHAAVTRADRSGNPLGGWRKDEAISLAAAFCAFTRDAAYAAGDESRVGSLNPGQWADFILLEQNPFEMSVGDLWQVKVAETWLAGEPVFRGDKP